MTAPDAAPVAPGTAPTAPGRRRLTVLVAALTAVVVVVVAAVLVLTRGSGTAAADPVAATVPVALSAGHVPDGTTIGVLVTLGTDEAEGAGWNQAAQGAAVAAHRFTLGGTSVALATEDDRGTADGARAAVQRLAGRGVAGIVVATAGSHVEGALEAAAAAGVPLVLPYAPAGSADGAWSTAPDDAHVAAALTDALDEAARPLLVDAGGAPAGVPVPDTLTLRPGDDVAALAEEVARRTGGAATSAGAAASADAQPDDGAAPSPTPVADPNDAVLVSGPPTQQAAVVQTLQAAGVAVPVVLTPEATSPAFAAALRERGGAVSSDLVTVGAAWDDAVALRTDATGRAMSAFLGGVRVLAEDAQATNLTADQPFAAVAGAADSRSHDAVVALVRAVSAARDDDPARVAEALGTLTLSAADGIAGPELDLTRPAALTGDVAPLHASAQELGLRPRPADGAARLTWFAAPETP